MKNLQKFYIPFLAVSVVLAVFARDLLIPLYLTVAAYTFYILLGSKMVFSKNKSIQSLRIFFHESIQDLFRRKGKAVLYVLPLLIIFPLADRLKYLGIPDVLYTFLVFLLLGMALFLFLLIAKTLSLGKHPNLKS